MDPLPVFSIILVLWTNSKVEGYLPSSEQHHNITSRFSSVPSPVEIVLQVRSPLSSRPERQRLKVVCSAHVELDLSTWVTGLDWEAIAVRLPPYRSPTVLLTIESKAGAQYLSLKHYLKPLLCLFGLQSPWKDKSCTRTKR